ncbi:MAG: hypothetical protein H6733_01245 [Alphaproteobacteria bacterium]|nr:hypothetical protein [Alphaproteobacteria bacterium]
MVWAWWACWLGTAAFAASPPSDAVRGAEAAALALAAAPQDYAAAVAAARAWDAAGRPEEAERAWAIARELSAANAESQRGYGWSALAAGHPGAARSAFDQRLDADADDVEARGGLRLSRLTGRPWRADVVTTFGVAPSLDTLRQTWSLLGSATWHPDSGVRLRIGYRYGRSDFDAAALTARGLLDADAVGTGVYSGQSHQVSLLGGYDVRRFGVWASGLLTVDGTGARDAAGHVAVGARVAVFGDLSVSASYGRWPDSDIAGGELAWSVPVGGLVRLQPFVSGQVVVTSAETQPLGVAGLAVQAGDDRVWGWLGGRYGRAFRPLLHGPMVVVDLPGELAWGAWAGLGGAPSGSVRVDAGYTLDALETTDGTHLLHGVLVQISVGP